MFEALPNRYLSTILFSFVYLWTSWKQYHTGCILLYFSLGIKIIFSLVLKSNKKAFPQIWQCKLACLIMARCLFWKSVIKSLWTLKTGLIASFVIQKTEEKEPGQLDVSSNKIHHFENFLNTVLSEFWQVYLKSTQFYKADFKMY